MFKRIIFIMMALLCLESSNLFGSELEQVKNIDRSIRDLKRRLQEMEGKFQNSNLKNPRDEESIQNLRGKIDGLQDDLVSMAAGIDWSSLQGTKELAEKRDLIKEVQELLAPFLDTIRRMSERPRKIEKLRKELRNVEIKLSVVDEGLDNLRLMKQRGSKAGPDVVNALSNVEERLKGKRRDYQLDQGVAQNKLEVELKQQKSVVGEISELVENVLKTKGKNLIIALLVFMLIQLPMVGLQKRFINNYLEKKSDHHRANWQLVVSWGGRSLAFGGAMLTLYLLNDWFLFTAFTLIILSIFWSTRQLVPHFLKELRIIFNMGTVREGEVLEHEGILYRVEKLSFFSILRNERLEGGVLRITARNLVDLHSRPYNRDTPLFPTRVGDWVRMNGVVQGKVRVQTPEEVIIERFGGALQAYKTTAFLQASPENISHGFILSVVLCLDYCYQNQVQQMIEALQRELSQRLSSQGEFKKIAVDFAAPGEVGLEFAVNVTCHGKFAENFHSLQRLIQRTLVQLCSERSWTIASRQLVVQMKGNYAATSPLAKN